MPPFKHYWPSCADAARHWGKLAIARNSALHHRFIFDHIVVAERHVASETGTSPRRPALLHYTPF